MSLRISFSQGDDIFSSSEYWFFTGMSVALPSSCQTMALKWWGMPFLINSWGTKRRSEETLKMINTLLHYVVRVVYVSLGEQKRSRWEQSITWCWQDIHIISLYNDNHSAYINALLFTRALHPFMIYMKAKLCCFCVSFGVSIEFAASRCHVVWLVRPHIFPWLILCPPVPSSIFSSPGFSLLVTEDTNRKGGEKEDLERRLLVQKLKDPS